MEHLEIIIITTTALALIWLGVEWMDLTSTHRRKKARIKQARKRARRTRSPDRRD